MNSDIWQSPAAFDSAFWQGVEQQLNSDSLGALILATANASFDADVFARLQDQILARLNTARQRVAGDLRRGHEPSDAPDDLAVLLRLVTVGFDWLAASQRRDCDPWQVSLHPLRAFRPKRMANAQFEGLHQPFSANRFHFNKPFLKPEIFWEDDLLGIPTTLLFNKFPFIEMHGILVPERSAERPQFLSQTKHLWAADVADMAGETLPGFGLAYNSNGAMASVNHLHLQSFVRHTPLPIENPSWQHNGGAQAYPIPVQRFRDAQSAWGWIADRHEANAPYNLLYRQQQIWAIGRQPLPATELPNWSPGLAWSEACGLFATSDAQAFQNLQSTTLTKTLGLLNGV